MKRLVYLIPGMLADERLFSYLNFDKEKFEVIHLAYDKWVHVKSIQEIAEILSAEIPKDSSYILIGSSMGAMIAYEIAHIKTPYRLILIAGAKSRKEIPLVIKLLFKIGLLQILPVSFFNIIKKQRPKYELQNLMLSKKTNVYLKKCLLLVASWIPSDLNEELPIYHIHGQKDKVIPSQNIKADRLIPDAGHYMCLTHYREVQEFIDSIV